MDEGLEGGEVGFRVGVEGLEAGGEGVGEGDGDVVDCWL